MHCSFSLLKLLHVSHHMSRVSVKKVATASFKHFQPRFERHSKSRNPTSLPATDFIAQDPCHPLHIQVRRRHDAFDPNKLHWAVRCPATLCKKRTIRSWVTRRVRDAFLAELKANGFNANGLLLRDTQVSAVVVPTPISIAGALRIHLQNSVVKAPISEVRQDCQNLLQKIVASQTPRQRNTKE